MLKRAASLMMVILSISVLGGLFWAAGRPAEPQPAPRLMIRSITPVSSDRDDLGRRSAGAEVRFLRLHLIDEPVAGQHRHLFQRAGLLEQVRGAGHDLEPGLTA
ncbi:MAG: hypothetical protein QOJ19_595 [Acidimicrobiia bacterium]|nr:hypothetical protein [Acidimicrobiia bacterium]